MNTTSNTAPVAQLAALGFAAPYAYCADGSVIAAFNGNPYNIHVSATPDKWKALQEDIKNGFITVGAYVAPPPTPVATLAANALAQVRDARTSIISTLDGLQASALTTGDTATAKAIETAKQGLRDITKTDISTCQTAADFAAAYKAAYAKIVAGAPASVLLAFAQALA
jgi:hypothetical protein